MTIEFGYRTPTTSDSEFYSTTTTTQYLVTSVRTKLWISFVGVTHGLVAEHLSRTIVSLVRLAQGPRHPDTDHTVTSDNSQFRTNPGTRFPWTSSNSYHPPKVSQPSS